MANKKGGPKESKTKATSKLRSASPSSRYGLSETDLDQMGESTDSSGPRSATSSPAESEKGSEGAIVSADVDSSPIGEDYLKLEKAGGPRLQLRNHAGLEQRDTASAESAASSTVQEGTFELSELKVLLADLRQDIKKSEKANEKATAKAHERLKQEMKQANECLRQEIQQANERLRQEVQLELRQVLGKIEERIEKNSAKLSTLADRLEHLSETFTNRIEIAEHLAASAEERAVNVSSESHEAPVFSLQPPEPQSRDDFLNYFCPLTLDINTPHRLLHLSEGNKKVTLEGTVTKYPYHPDRFDCYYQVLCREALTGTRCYWEVECSGDFMRIGVAYKGLRRKGWGGDCCLGYNDKSWCLRWSRSQYSVRHNKKETVISAPYSPRIGTRSSDRLSPDELFTADLSPAALFSLLSPRPLLQSPLCDLIKALVCLVTQVLVTAAHWQSFKLYRLTAMLSCRLMFVLVEVVSC
ncbi:TRI16 protein, partial [Polypterus senegalus]